MPTESIFLDINLPNAATWFYFSALLSIALFFKFSRFFSIRNLDVLSLFLPMPGLLLLVESRSNRWGFVWLMAATSWFFLRCMFDLVLTRRPALAPNLSLSGLAWMAGTLYVSLVAVAARQVDERGDEGDKAQTLLDAVSLRVVQGGHDASAVTPNVRLWVERSLTLTCHLAIVGGLILVGWRHFNDLHAGVAAATCYLLLPYTYLLMPGSALGTGRWDHTWPMALMVWSVLAYRRPTLAGCFLGLAAGSVFFPVVTLPAWIGFYWKRGLTRFLCSFLLAGGLLLTVVLSIVLADGPLAASLRSAWPLSGWQLATLPENARSIWQGHDWSLHWAYRLPVFIAYVSFLSITLFWPAPKDLAHVLALSTAAMLGLQFWYADQGGIHVLWYLPFLLLLVFRPNLTACQPPLVPTDDWIARLGKSLGSWLWQLLKPPQPTTPVG